MKKDIAEREINVIDMFWYVCLKWRSIFACAVIFAILAGGFSYMKSANAIKAASEEKETVTLEELEVGLESYSKGKVNAYIDYLEMYDKQSEYNELAPRMQLDASGYYRNVLTYYVDNHYTVEYPLIDKANNINAILEAYTAQVNGVQFTEKLKENLSIDEEIYPYVPELIECTIGNNSSASDELWQIITISISGTNKEMCDDLTMVVKEAMDSGKDNVVKQIGEHDIKLIKDICIFQADDNLLLYQKQNVEKLISLSTAMEKLKGELTQEELACVDAYINELERESSDKEVTDEELVTMEPTVSKKLIFVGFFLGAILAAGIAVFMYLINSRIRLEDEFENVYGVKLLGNVIVKKEGKKHIFTFVDNFINKLRHINKHYFEEDEAISMVAAGIKIGAKKLETSKVYLTGAVMGNKEKAVIKKLTKELEKSNIEVMTGRPILYDAEALEKSAEIGCIVLVESAGVSLYNEVADEIEICEHQGTKILGAVVVA